MQRSVSRIVVVALLLSLCLSGIVATVAPFVSAATPPDAPANVTVNTGNKTLTLYWTSYASTFNGGSAVDSIAIYYGTSPGARTNVTTASGSATSYLFNNLVLGQRYYFALRAHNSAGWSSESREVNATFAAFPYAPRNLTIGYSGIATSMATATISWEDPLNTGGVPLTHYIVSVSHKISYHLPPYYIWTYDAYATVGPDVNSYVVDSLVRGGSYSVRVEAYNAVGYSYVSQLIVPPATTPSAPTNLRATPGYDSVTIYWDASGGGGSSILGYYVTYGESPTALSTNVSAGTNLYRSVSGLTVGVEYYFSVQAYSALGWSPVSPVLAATPIARTVPNAPTSVQVTGFPSGLVYINWYAPVSNGGYSVDEYAIRYSTEPGGVGTTVSAGMPTPFEGEYGYVLQDLVPGQTYYIAVLAHNTLGWSVESTEVSILYSVVPSTPRNLNITYSGDDPSHTTATLSWDAPLSDGGRPITNYTVDVGKWYSGPYGPYYASLFHGVVGPGTTSCEMNLTRGAVDFACTVEATNAAGYSNETYILITTPCSAPAPPNYIVYPGYNQATIRIYPSAENGGTSVNSYMILYGTAPGDRTFNVTISADPSSYDDYVFNDLTENDTIYCVVLAHNNIGWSAASAEIIVTSLRTTPVAPTSPTSVQAFRGDGVISLVWYPPTDNGGRGIDNYSILYGTSPGAPSVNLSVGLPYDYVGSPYFYYEITGLTNGQAYYFTILAHNEVGWSPGSAEVACTPAAKPSVPLNVTISYSGSNVLYGSAIIDWDEPSSNGGSAITSYFLDIGYSYQPAPFQPYRWYSYYHVTIDPSVTSVSVTDLIPRTSTYTLIIYANNSVGSTPFSTSIIAPAVAPAAPSSLTALPSYENITLSWPRPSSGGAAIDHYEILYGTSPDDLLYVVNITATTDSSMTYRINGLEVGTNYYFSVRAHNSQGWSPGSPVASSIFATVPSEPLYLDVMYIESDTLLTSAVVYWEEPAFDGGAPLTRYRATVGFWHSTGYHYEYNGILDLSTLSFVVHNLSRGCTYEVRVVADGLVASSVAQIDYTPPVIAPSAPRDLQVIPAGEDSVKVRWGYADENGASIDQYKVCYGSASGSWTIEVTEGQPYTDVTITGLDSGWAYYFVVLAHNSAGWSIPSNEVCVVLISAADNIPPDLISCTPANGATGVSLSASMVLRFSEAMNKSTVEAAFQLLLDSDVVPGTFAWSEGDTVTTFTPLSLAVSTTYAVVMGSGATDVPGNPLDPFSFQFTTEADNTPPVTSLVLSGTLDANGYYINAVTVSLSATDAHSAVDHVEYSLDGSTWLTYDGPFLSTAKGQYYLYYRSEDNWGNIEATRSTLVSVSGITITRPLAVTEWYVSTTSNLGANVQFTKSGTVGVNFQFDLYKGGEFIRTIGSSGQFITFYYANWTQGLVSGDDYQIKVRSTTYPAFWTMSEEFTINVKPLITEPVNGLMVFPGDVERITWQGSFVTSDSYKLELTDQFGTALYTIATGLPASGYIDWTVPFGQYPGLKYLKLTSENDTLITSSVYVYLRIILPPLADQGDTPYYYSGTVLPIQWASDGSMGDVRIDLYLRISDTEYVFDRTIAITPDNGSYYWTIPVELNDLYKLKITKVGDETFNETSARISIWRSYIDLTAPDGGETWYLSPVFNPYSAVSFDPSTNLGHFFDIYLYQNGSLVKKIGTTQSYGTYWYYFYYPDWMSGITSGTGYRIKIVSQALPAVTDMSEGDFTIIVNPTVTSPNGLVVWTEDEVRTITWTTGGLGGQVDISLLRNGEFVALIASAVPNTGSYEWTVPALNGFGYSIKVSLSDDANASGVSSGDLALSVAMSVTITSPVPGSVWVQGTDLGISWITTGLNGGVYIELFQYGYNPENYLWSSNGVGIGSTTFTIPSWWTSHGQYRLRITTVAPYMYSGGSTVWEESIFTISKPDIEVTSPSEGQMLYIGDEMHINWTWAMPTTEPLNIRLYVISDGTPLPATWVGNNGYIGSSLGNNGQYGWTISGNIASTWEYLVRVESVTEPSIGGFSPGGFLIVQPPQMYSPTSGSLFVGSGVELYLIWDPISSQTVRVDLYRDGSFVSAIAENVSSSPLLWNIPTGVPLGEGYTIKLTLTNDTSRYDLSDGTFTMALPTITMLSPTTGGYLYGGYNNSITWLQEMSYTDVRLELYKGETLYQEIAVVSTVGSYNAYTWHLPVNIPSGSDYYLLVSSVADDRVYAITPINVEMPYIQITQPNGGEIFGNGTGGYTLIKWTASSMVNQHQFRVSLLKGGEVVSVLYPSVGWSVSYYGAYFEYSLLAPGDDYQILVTSLMDTNVTDTSDDDFIVVGQPEAPTGLTAQYISGNVLLNWTAPADAGGAPITAYFIYRDGVWHGFTSGETSYIDAAVIPGITYVYQVQALNQALGSSLSASISITPQVPQAPAALFNAPSVTSSTTVNFNASSSHSKDTPPGTIQVRWDWNNDGVWDTEYSAELTADHAFSGGSHTVALQVLDSNGLTNTTSHSVYVDVILPSVGLTPSGTTGTNGWYTSSVSVTIPASDNYGIASVMYRIDSGIWAPYTEALSITSEGSHTVYGLATDIAGNQRSVQLDIKIDTIAPIIEGAPTTSPNGNGWYNHSVTVHFTASDGGSGVASVTSDQLVTAEGYDLWVIGTVTDQAGNSATVTVMGINIDMTGPVISVQYRSPNGNGWYNSPVTANFTASDDLSSPTIGSYSHTFSDEGAGQSYIWSVIDLAGNVAQYMVSGINIDLTAPTGSASPATSPNVNGWYNDNVEMVFSLSDALSGISGSISPTSLIVVEGASVTASIIATDLAGNTALIVSPAVKLDKTAPTAMVTPTTSPNSHGWYNSNVTMSFVLSDQLSGVDGSSSVTALITSEGLSSFVSVVATDLAGNTATIYSPEIKLDRTAPTGSAEADRPANAYGWYNADVNISFTVDDGLSGIDLSRSGELTSVITAEGIAQTRSVTVYDLAGNSVTLSSPTVSIDKTAPAGYAYPTTDANGNLWYDGDVIMRFVFSDALSGINGSLTIDVTITGEGAFLDVSCDTVDRAGNRATIWSPQVNIDRTAPSGSWQASSLPNSNGWYRSDVTMEFLPGTDLSGLDSDLSDPLTQVISSEGAGRTVTITLIDLAGNSASFTSPAINLDKTAPTGSAEAASAPNSNGWYNEDVTMVFTVDTGLSGFDVTLSDSLQQVITTEGSAQSVSVTIYDGAGNRAVLTSPSVKLDKTAPEISGSPTTAPNVNGWWRTDVTIDFEASDLLSGLDTLTSDVTVVTEGKDQAFVGQAIDQAGNIATIEVKVSIDKTAPDGSAQPTTEPNTNGWYNADVVMQYSLSDSLSGIDGPVEPTVVVSIEGEAVTGEYLAMDMAGNTVTIVSPSIKLDKTAPVITGTPTTAPTNGWYNHDVVVHFTATDLTSGVDSVTADVVLSEGADQSATGIAVDAAGNSATFTVTNINIDTTAPSGSAVPTTLPNINGWYNIDVTMLFSLTDALSGIDGDEEIQVLIDEEGASIIVSVVATDLAGNTATITSPAVSIDRTAPVIDGVPLSSPNANGWYNEDVTIRFEASDELSGLLVPTWDVVMSVEGAGQEVTQSATDLAGNVATFTVGDINIDTTAPTIIGEPTSTANTQGWYNADVTVHFTATDGLSGVAAAPEDIVVAGEGSSLAATATVLDLAGNSASISVPIKIDRLVPTTTLFIGDAPYDGNGPTTIAGPGSFALSATDGLSGVDEIRYRVDGGEWELYSEPFVLSKGEHTLTYCSIDQAGNAESEQQVTVKVIAVSGGNPPPAGGSEMIIIAIVVVAAGAAAGVFLLKRRKP